MGRLAGDSDIFGVGGAAIAALHASRPLDGVFCADDLCALGAVNALCRAGFSIPEDVRVIGYDDIPAADWDANDLTTFEQDLPAMIWRMSSPEAGAGERVLIPPRPVERASTGPDMLGA